MLIEHGFGLRAAPGARTALLEKRLDPDQPDPTDRELTPVQLAAMGATFRPETFDLLLAKTRVTAKDLAGESWEWLFHMFGKNAVRSLAKKFGAKLSTTKTQISLLHLAAAAGAVDVVQELLAKGADPSLKTKRAVRFAGVSVDKGATALKVATALQKAGHRVAREKVVSVRSPGCGALHGCARRNCQT